MRRAFVPFGLGLLITLLSFLLANSQPTPPSNLRIPPDPNDRRTLTVTKGGTGTGTVSGPGITCGGDCTENFIVDTTTVLFASPAGGSTFTGWSGACTGTGTCSVLMSQARAVTATFTLTASGPPWTGILASSRATDWSGAGATIPTTWTRCGSVIAAYTGAATTINNAITACGSNQYVELGSGTFTLSSGIAVRKSNVMLRGAGAGSTILVINAGASCPGIGTVSGAVTICPPNANFGTNRSGFAGPQHTATWSAGYSQNTTSITISSSTGLEVDSVIWLDQIEDTVTDGLTDGWPGAGDVLVCASGNAPPCSAEGGNSYARTSRIGVEGHRVTSITGSAPNISVGISPGIIAPYYRSGQTPGAWWGNRSGAVGALENVGLENVTVDWTGTGSSTAAVMTLNCANCWTKGVRHLFRTASASFVLGQYVIQCFRCTIRDSYFWGAATEGASFITNYTITPHLTTALLVENNIIHHTLSPILPNDPDVGSVYAYNYTNDTGSAWNNTTMGTQLHGTTCCGLWEGNNFGQVYGDDNHGTHHFHTFFRNHIDATAHNQTSGSTNAGFALLTHSRFFNLIGNVIGSTFYTGYGSTDGSDTIYSLNWKGNCSFCSPLPTDSHVTRTLMRWGNWDSITSSNDTGTNDSTGTRFVSSEVPSGITNFANPVPASQTLPPSFYLSAQPSWWATLFGTPAWPPIGPDVSSGNNNSLTAPLAPSGGHANKIPARLCFEGLSDDPAYPTSSPRIKLFSAATCYP